MRISGILLKSWVRCFLGERVNPGHDGWPRIMILWTKRK